MMTSNVHAVADNDAELVAASLAGNRDAFGQIVSRYQSLICSLAYSATGSLGQSEDLAQETFITAWKHLRHLREQNKLRAWLCGIARNRINSSLRRDGREPLRDAEQLDAVPESASPEPLPHDQTISKEEEAILWRSLNGFPKPTASRWYVLSRTSVHRECGRSAELSEDAVKQRLSRGRKLLHEQVLAFVEGALERTNPVRPSPIGVIASLPIVLSTSAKAATSVRRRRRRGRGKIRQCGGIAGRGFRSVARRFRNYIGYRVVWRKRVPMKSVDLSKVSIAEFSWRPPDSPPRLW